MRILKFSVTARILVASMFFTGLLISCEKGDFENGGLRPAEKDAGQPSFNEGNTDTGNANAYLGKHHIYALEELSKHSDFPDSISGKDVYKETKNYLKDSLSGNHFLDYAESQNTYQDFIEDTANDKQAYAQLSPKYFPGYLKGHVSLSLEATGYLDDLEGTYENLQTVSGAIGEIKAIETEVAADTGLKLKESEMLTGLLAIARKSLVYWDQIIQTPSHNWHAPFVEELGNEEATDLMRNLSLGSACAYGLVFTDEYKDGQSITASHSAGVNQASFHPGPGTIVDIEL